MVFFSLIFIQDNIQIRGDFHPTSGQYLQLPAILNGTLIWCYNFASYLKKSVFFYARRFSVNLRGFLGVSSIQKWDI